VNPWLAAGWSWALVKPSWVHAGEAGHPGPLGSVRMDARVCEEVGKRTHTRGHTTLSGRTQEDEWT